jgi:putative heme-binding domain-containing protein
MSNGSRSGRSLFLSFVLLAEIVGIAGLASAQEEQASVREAWSTSKISGSPDPAPPYRAELAFPNLKFVQPLDLTPAPGSDRLFVAEQGGRILSFSNRSDVGSADLVVDLKETHPDLSAVYAITFHPKFESNRKVYICYIQGNEKPDGTFVSEFQMAGDVASNANGTSGQLPTIDPSTEKVIIRWWSGGHNGCSLKFGPDGYLYISTGDGGAPSPPDPLMAGQDVSNLLSNILRINVDHPASDLAYGIPADNPFIGMENVRPEIWAFGFRNPWRMSFDRVKGDLWVGDVGWQLWEMIYRVERGGNYGWPIMEGPQAALPESKRGPAPISPPVVSHPHSEAASITGGFVYHGSQLPELQGVYVYGDFQSGKIWGLKHDGRQMTWHKELAQTPLQLVSFGEDNAGEIFLVDYQRTQQIYRLVPNPDDGQHAKFPRKLSETGLFANVANQSPADGVLQYEINAHHWADHTQSERWMAVPGKEPVQIESDSKWMILNGSVLAKTVSIEMIKGQPSSVRRLETQILHREADSWRPYTFAWNDDQTDAELVPSSGFSRLLSIQDVSAPEGLREQTYRFAARSECQMCHNPWVEMKTTSVGIQTASPLGLSLMQLNRQADGRDSENQLVTLQKAGWISGKIPTAPDEAPRFADPYETTASLNVRVRSYLHVNCAHCHQPHAGGSAIIELAHDVKLEDAKLLNAKPGQGAFGISDAALIRPGDPLGSVLHYRLAKTGSGRMPRIGSEEIDDVAVSMIHKWIREMPVTEASTSTPAAKTDNSELLSSFSTMSAEARLSAVQQLTSTTRGATELMLWVQLAETPNELRQEIVTLVSQSTQPEVRDLFERFMPASKRAKMLGTAINSAELLAMEADVERGRQLFLREGSASCRNCHRIKESGETLGPDLSQIAKKYTPAEMLTHLLEPSRFIDVKYIPQVVETVDGLVHTGLLVERSETELVLKSVQNKEIRIAMADVESMTSQQKSIMPELLLRDMTPQQAADLLAYLNSLK